jgi:hypothetical protein
MGSLSSYARTSPSCCIRAFFGSSLKIRKAALQGLWSNLANEIILVTEMQTESFHGNLLNALAILRASINIVNIVYLSNSARAALSLMASQPFY